MMIYETILLVALRERLTNRCILKRSSIIIHNTGIIPLILKHSSSENVRFKIYLMVGVNMRIGSPCRPKQAMSLTRRNH